jgi:hypothetical protein
MSDLALLYIPVASTVDGDAFTAEVQFKDTASASLSAPGAVEFRIDDVTDPASPVLVLDWTAVTADDAVSIAIASSYNAILTAAHEYERKQLTVTGDRGQTFQCSAQKVWTVRNSRFGT